VNESPGFKLTSGFIVGQGVGVAHTGHFGQGVGVAHTGHVVAGQGTGVAHTGHVGQGIEVAHTGHVGQTGQVGQGGQVGQTGQGVVFLTYNTTSIIIITTETNKIISCWSIFIYKDIFGKKIR